MCGLLAAGLVNAQSQLDRTETAAQADCGSVVIVKCERPAVTDAPAQVRQRSRDIAFRRQSAGVQQLDGVVIEADVIRRRSIEEIIGSAFPPLRARDGTYTFATGDGSQCTCMNVCPPWPLPCCTCSSLMNRYISTPGSSPLN